MVTKSQRSRSERTAALIREQARKERRRQLVVLAAVISVVLAAVGIGFAVNSARDTTGNAADAPAGSTEEYGVVIGDVEGPRITIYEDLQCPACRALEAEVGEELQQAAREGRARVDYRVISFLDPQSTNQYSSRAANAAMVVLDTAGKDAFLEFHDLLFQDQPPEGGEGLSDDQLIEYAVKAGAAEDEVTGPIRDQAFDQWIVNATDRMSRDGVSSTPTVLIDGEVVAGDPVAAIRAVIG